MSMDIAKKQLEKLDVFIEGLQKELVTLAQYTDVGPSRALYAHVRDLIKELLDEKDPQKFAQMFQGVNQAVAGILIVIVPSAAGKVNRNMQKAHGKDFDPSDLNDLVNSMNNSMPNMPTGNGQNQPDVDEDFIEEDGEPKVENKAEDIVRMLNLENHVKPQNSDKKDKLGDVFDKYKQ